MSPDEAPSALGPDPAAANVRVVERFLASLSGRWPTEDELDALLSPDIRVVDRPSLVNPSGGERDRAGVSAGIAAGRGLLAVQSYEVLGHVALDDAVVTRMLWSGELAIDAGPWPAGTRMRAWCVGHYLLADGRIARIEQHDCYAPPEPPPPE